MFNNTMKRFSPLPVFCSVLLLLYSTSCQFTSLRAEEHVLEKIEKTFSIKAGGGLTIVSEFGAIDIQTAEQDKVEIVVTKSTTSLNRSVKEALADFEVAFDPREHRSPYI